VNILTIPQLAGCMEQAYRSGYVTVCQGLAYELRTYYS
jgi:hypothetical protein